MRKSREWAAASVVIGLLLIAATLATSYYFRFSGPKEFGFFGDAPEVRFDRNGELPSRNMTLLKDFSYTDPTGKVWTARAPYSTDGASIPPVFWSIIGGPFEGPHREAAIIHDYYCFTKTVPHQDVHRVFYYALRAAGVSEQKSKIFYAAVVAGGPTWAKKKSTCFASCHQGNIDIQSSGELMTITRNISSEEARELVDWVKSEDPDLTEIDKKARPTHGM